MNTFTTRVELQSSNPDDFDMLHTAMGLKGFVRFIISDNGLKYQLPRGEYSIQTSSPRSNVLEMAKLAVLETKRTAEILVTESKGRSWHGLGLIK